MDLVRTHFHYFKDMLSNAHIFAKCSNGFDRRGCLGSKVSASGDFSVSRKRIRNAISQQVLVPSLDGMRKKNGVKKKPKPNPSPKSHRQIDLSIAETANLRTFRWHLKAI